MSSNKLNEQGWGQWNMIHYFYRGRGHIVLASSARIAASDHEEQYHEKQQAHHWDVSGLGRSLPEVMAPG
jgi:hypothetical protein